MKHCYPISNLLLFLSKKKTRSLQIEQKRLLPRRQITLVFPRIPDIRRKFHAFFLHRKRYLVEQTPPWGFPWKVLSMTSSSQSLSIPFFLLTVHFLFPSCHTHLIHHIAFNSHPLTGMSPEPCTEWTLVFKITANGRKAFFYTTYETAILIFWVDVYKVLSINSKWEYTINNFYLRVCLFNIFSSRV